MTARTFLQKAMRCRRQMMRQGVSKRNTLRASAAIRKVEGWLNAYPKADDRKVAAFIQRNSEAVYTILPGVSSAAGESMRAELNHIIQLHHVSQPRDRRAYGVRN